MSTLFMLLKVVLVFGLLALVLWVLKRTDGLGGRARGGLLEVRGSTRLGKGAALTVVRMDGKDLLLGVTDHTVTLLTSEPAMESLEVPAPRKSLVEGLRPALAVLGNRPGKVSDQAVAEALATLRGEPARVMTEGTVTSSRLATRRRVARTDALRDEEHPWNRACRPTFRTADGDDALL